MFKKIDLISHVRNNNCRLRKYEIVDSNFKSIVKILIPLSSGFCYAGLRTVLIVKEYSKRKLPVVKNLVEFYRKFNVEELCSDQLWIDENFPDLEFGEKYDKCIWRELKKSSNT